MTEEGNGVVHSEVVRALNGAGLAAEEMQLDFPHHSAIDGAHPEIAFQSQGSHTLSFYLCKFHPIL